MFRQPSSIETPLHFLQGLYDSRVRYNEYNGLVSALGRQKIKQQQIPKRGKKLSEETLYRKQDWEFKVYDIHQKALRYYKLPNTFKNYQIQDYIPVTSNIYSFWVRNFQTKQDQKQEQSLFFFSIPKISQQQMLQQDKKIELTFWKQHNIQICRIEQKQIKRSDFFTQTRQISYVQSLKCVRLVWKFSNKQGGIFLVNILQGPASVKPKAIVRIQYIPITSIVSQQKLISWTFYTGFRNLFGSYLILDPKELNEKSYSPILGETEQKCPLTIYRPMILVYHPVSQLPNHMLEGQNLRQLSLIAFITNQKEFKWPNQKYVCKILISNYLFGLDGNEQTQLTDVNEILTSLTLCSDSLNPSNQSSYQKKDQIMRLTGITMHENKYRILRIQLNVDSSNGSVIYYSEHAFNSSLDKILITYDVGGYVINFICENSYLCQHHKDQSNELIHTYVQNECSHEGNRYLVQQNVMYICFFNQNSQKYEIMNSFIVPNLVNYHQLQVYYDAGKNLRILQQIECQNEQIQAYSDKNNKKVKNYIKITQLTNKKLLYMQILQKIYTKQTSTKQTTQTKEAIFIENIAKYMLQLL